MFGLHDVLRYNQRGEGKDHGGAALSMFSCCSIERVPRLDAKTPHNFSFLCLHAILKPISRSPFLHRGKRASKMPYTRHSVYALEVLLLRQTRQTTGVQTSKSAFPSSRNGPTAASQCARSGSSGGTTARFRPALERSRSASISPSPPPRGARESMRTHPCRTA